MLRASTSTSCLLIALAALSACDRQSGGSSGGSSPTPSPSPECTPAANQTSVNLVYDCAITRNLPDVLIDPVDSSNTACTPVNLTNPQANEERDSRLLTLSSQRFTAPALRFTYGTGGDDSASRVRVDISLGSGTTHTSRLGKTRPDCSAPSATVPVTMGIAGNHVALIDKTQTPMCVFESRYTPGTVTFSIGAGGPPGAAVPGATRRKIDGELAQALDLEAAQRINRILGAASEFDDAFVARSGRCADGYEPFDG